MPTEDTQNTPVEDTLELMTAASVENCGLSERELMLVRLTALVAVGASPTSYVLNAGAAAESSVTLEDVQDILVAAAPIVGTARVVTAVGKIGKALGFIIGEIAEAEMATEAG
jgi:hypothetical protein